MSKDNSIVLADASHYTSSSCWAFMNSGYFGDPDFFNPYKPLVPEKQSPHADDEEKFIFAFYDGENTEKWKNCAEFPDIWERIMRHTMQGDFLQVKLKFPILNSDETYMVDWAHMERVREELKKTSVFQATSQDLKRIAEASERYVKSMARLSDYDDSFVLPELVIKNKIPMSRIDCEEVWNNGK